MLNEREKNLIRKLDLEYPAVAIKLNFEKPNCMHYDGPPVAFCQFVKYAQDSGKHFYTEAADDQCYGKLPMGMIDFPPVPASGQAGYDYGVFKQQIANQQIYQNMSVLVPGTVRYVEFCPAADADFQPDLLFFVASLDKADIILRATSYLTGEPWESKSTPVLSCSWMYAYPIISGKPNHITTGLYHGLKRRKAYPAGLMMISVPFQKFASFFRGLEEMDWTLIAFRDDEASKAELAKKMAHWQKMAEESGTKMDLR